MQASTQAVTTSPRLTVRALPLLLLLRLPVRTTLPCISLAPPAPHACPPPCLPHLTPPPENQQLEELLSRADAQAAGGSGEISRLEDELARAQAARISAEAATAQALAAKSAGRRGSLRGDAACRPAVGSPDDALVCLRRAALSALRISLRRLPAVHCPAVAAPLPTAATRVVARMAPHAQPHPVARCYHS